MAVELTMTGATIFQPSRIARSAFDITITQNPKMQIQEHRDVIL
jgi:hypothetical protein